MHLRSAKLGLLLLFPWSPLSPQGCSIEDLDPEVDGGAGGDAAARADVGADRPSYEDRALDATGLPDVSGDSGGPPDSPGNDRTDPPRDAPFDGVDGRARENDSDVDATPDALEASIPDGSADAGPIVGWTPAVRIGHDDLANPISNANASVVVAGNGDALVAFADQAQIWARRYVKATDSWDPLFLINDGSSPGGLPMAGIDGSGNAAIAWTSGAAGGALNTRYFLASRGWPAGWLAAQAAEPGQANISLALTGFTVTSGGYPVVTWTARDPSAASRAYLRMLGNVISSHGVPGRYEISAASKAVVSSSVAANEIGEVVRVVAAWSQTDSIDGGNIVNARGVVYDFDVTKATATSGPAASLEVDEKLLVFVNAVQMDAAGNATVLMLQRDDVASAPNVLVNRYTGSSWSGPVTINASPGATSPSLAVDRDGAAIVGFRQCSPCGLWARRFDGFSWRPGARLTPDGDDSGDEIAIAIDGKGRSLAVWRGKMAGVSSAMASELGTAGVWSAQHELDGELNVSNGMMPRIGFGHDGTGIAAWIREEATTVTRRKLQGAVYKH